MLLPERRQQPRKRLLQDRASIWPHVVLPRRYVGVPEKAVCRVAACGGGGEPFATATATTTAAVNGTAPADAGVSGRPRHVVRNAAVFATAAAINAVTTAAVNGTIAAAATINTAAAIAAATATVFATVAAAAATVAAATSPGTCTAAADFAAGGPGAGYVYPGPGGRRCAEG